MKYGGIHMTFGEHIKTSDWKKEKHVPVIEAPAKVKKGEPFMVTAAIGKEVAHPNTTEHHIRYISLFFKPKDGPFVFNLGRCEFCAHGESPEGPNTGPAYTHHSATFVVSLSAPGTLHAISFCNIHGLWEDEREIAVE